MEFFLLSNSNPMAKYIFIIFKIQRIQITLTYFWNTPLITQHHNDSHLPYGILISNLIFTFIMTYFKIVGKKYYMNYVKKVWKKRFKPHAYICVYVSWKSFVYGFHLIRKGKLIFLTMNYRSKSLFQNVSPSCNIEILWQTCE